jgi:hypothetical protein
VALLAAGAVEGALPGAAQAIGVLGGLVMALVMAAVTGAAVPRLLLVPVPRDAGPSAAGGPR